MQHIYNFDVLQEGPLGPGARNLSRLEGCMGGRECHSDLKTALTLNLYTLVPQSAAGS